MFAKQASELVWPVFLHEVTGPGQQLEPGAADPLGELGAARGGNPRIGFAPDHQRGRRDPAVQRLDLVGVPLIAVGDLPVERRLPGATEPRRDQGVLDRALERPRLRGPDIGTRSTPSWIAAGSCSNTARWSRTSR